MRRILLVILLFLICCGKCFALTIVYPKSKTPTINAKSTFFIGSTTPGSQVKVNGCPINVHKSGAFAYVLALNAGKNIYTIESGCEKYTYTITRGSVSSPANCTPCVFKAFAQSQTYIVTKDNAPLRNTPINDGINRISHFQKDIPLIVDGTCKDFFRVVLNDNTKAWVNKSDVKPLPPECTCSFATIKGYQRKKNSEFDIFVFDIDKKIPYTIKEEDTLTLTFYNVKDYPDSAFVFTIPLNEKLVGYSGKFEDDNTFIFKVRKYPKVNMKHPLKGLRIAIDPGHGGAEYGAIGCFGDKEKDINLSISKFLEEELKSRGADVVMIRKDDKFVGLRERVNIANKEDAMILLSLHNNALPDGKDPNQHKGTSVYYYYDQSKPLADYILNSLVTNAGTNNDKVRQQSFALVRNTDALSVLIEIAYMINPFDNEMLTNKEFQRKSAKAITDGLEDYFFSGP